MEIKDLTQTPQSRTEINIISRQAARLIVNNASAL